ncbi:chemokine-like protein orion isoform X2 [Megachile rotundata]|uniref:chemokine-like protein orion isoform X2 n=1 Tax=Megachile rotundata TaxID=143995 RepID=UPI003FD50727
MKEMKILPCFIFLFTIWEANCAYKQGITLIDQIRSKMLEHEKVLEKDLFNPLFDVFVEDEEKKYLHLIKSFKTFGDKLEQKFPHDNFEYLIPLNNVWLWARTEIELKDINGLYGVFRRMQHEIIDKKAGLDLDKLASFSETILRDPNASMLRALTTIADFIVQDKLFVSAYQAAASQICNENQSLQQLLYNLYTTITLSEIRGYSMVQFSYILLRLYNPGSNFTQEMAMVRQQYEMRTSETIRAVKTAMAFAPKDVWRCDVAEPKLDETYTYLNRLFQGYVVNEVDLNRQSTCRENCAYYSYSKVYGCYKNQFCQSQRKCNGKIVNCEYIDSDMWICPSSRESDRRYEYIEYENGNIFGQKKSCSNPKTKVDSWWRWIFWHCSYCFCYCDDSSAKSDRYFSLREVLSDVENNKVVTGIQLKKVNQIIHLQIKEGQLLPFGNINETNIQWKPVDAFSVLDTDVRKDVDYHTIMWEKRGVDLDVLEKDDNYLLTGVKFRTIGPRLNLEARFTPFNFTTGKLIDPVGRSVWVTNDVTDREKLKLEKPDIPTRQALLSLPDSKPNQYVNFEPSDRASDAAQNTIPFLDIQPVEPNPPVPLMGAGIYHKGRKGSGGYIAMKLVTYDFTRHLQADLPPAPPIINTTNEIQAV